jgi:hypothetical protein
MLALCLAGISVAILIVAMRLIETITIYLAAGAPFAVSYLLHASGSERRAIKLSRALAAGLLWPVAFIKLLIGTKAPRPSKAPANSSSIELEQKIDGAKRGLLAAIHKLSELAADVRGPGQDDLARVTCVLRENVETYVGLSPAICLSDDVVPSSDQASELYRVAGRKGDDLMLATRCARRRNLARIAEHYTRARFVLIHAIADVREALDRMRPSMVATGVTEQELRITAGELYRNAFDLFSLIGDEEAAMRVAELLNRELSRLRRMEVMESRNVSKKDTGEEQCRAHTSRPRPAHLSDQSTLARG